MARFPELVALSAYRIARDLSWSQLAAEMKREGADVAFRTLHSCCRHDAIRDRTLFKVRKFLAIPRMRRYLREHGLVIPDRPTPLPSNVERPTRAATTAVQS